VLVGFLQPANILEDKEMTRMRNYLLLSVALLALAPASAMAQDRPWHVNFGGGPTFLTGDIADKFGTGWGPAIGVTVNATPKVGFQFEYAYRWFDVQDNLPINATKFSANHQTHQLDFNLVANLTPTGSAARVYIVAGPGAYYRKVEITEYVGNGVICDPYWYVCGTYPIDAVIGSRGGWDFGFNVGGGVGFRLGEESEFYVESRYHYVAGPDVKSPSGAQGGSTSASYIPLTFGFRF
jgi:opacity protein-like surface antigen